MGRLSGTERSAQRPGNRCRRAWPGPQGALPARRRAAGTWECRCDSDARTSSRRTEICRLLISNRPLGALWVPGNTAILLRRGGRVREVFVTSVRRQVRRNSSTVEERQVHSSSEGLMRLVCAWCGGTVRDGSTPVSHCICEACNGPALAEVRRRMQTLPRQSA
jgi:hypothetical protein